MEILFGIIFGITLSVMANDFAQYLKIYKQAKIKNVSLSELANLQVSGKALSESIDKQDRLHPSLFVLAWVVFGVFAILAPQLGIWLLGYTILAMLGAAMPVLYQELTIFQLGRRHRQISRLSLDHNYNLDQTIRQGLETGTVGKEDQEKLAQLWQALDEYHPDQKSKDLLITVGYALKKSGYLPKTAQMEYAFLELPKEIPSGRISTANWFYRLNKSFAHELYSP